MMLRNGILCAVLGDMGAACETQGGLITLTPSQLPGRAAYMSEELEWIRSNKCNNEETFTYDATEADVWAFGVVIYLIFTNKPPWEYEDEKLNKYGRAIPHPDATDYNTVY